MKYPVSTLFICAGLLISCGQEPQKPASEFNKNSTPTVESSVDSPSQPSNANAVPEESMDELVAQRTELESQIETLNQEKTEAEQSVSAFNAPAPAGPIPGIGAGALGDIGAAQLGLDAAALDDLIEAAMDGDVDGIIDALMDLVADLQAQLDDLQAELDGVLANIEALDAK